MIYLEKLGYKLLDHLYDVHHHVLIQYVHLVHDDVLVEIQKTPN